MTRIYEPSGTLDLCPDCCRTLDRDTIADWPDEAMYARWDRYPWRPQDYAR